MKTVVKNVIGIFVANKGSVELLTKNSDFITLETNNNFDEVNKEFIKNEKFKNVDLKQCYAFSKYENDTLTINTLYVDLININNININSNYKLINISDLEESDYLNSAKEYFKNMMTYNTGLQHVWNLPFKLPEIQRTLEHLNNKNFDRRNFRKKLIDEIEGLNIMGEKTVGRPAMLYKFKDIKEKKRVL